MARGKVQMKRIENLVHRQVTFCKRRAGLLKKAKELSILCDADIGVIVFNDHGKLYELSTKGSMQGLLERYMKTGKGVQVSDEDANQPMDSEEEIALLKQEIQLLQKGLGYTFGGGSGTMTLDELDLLEKHLEVWIHNIRSTKTEIMYREVQLLKNREAMLKAANEYLQGKSCTIMATNKERIKNLEESLSTVQTNLRRLEVGVAYRFQHLEVMVSKMMKLINNDGKFIGDMICSEELVAMTTVEAERESLTDGFTAPVVHSNASTAYWFKNLNQLVELKKDHYFDFTASWGCPSRFISSILIEMPTFVFLKEGKIVNKVVGAKKDETFATTLNKKALIFCADIILNTASKSMGDDVGKYGTVRPAPKPPDSYNCDKKFTPRLMCRRPKLLFLEGNQVGITRMRFSYRTFLHCRLQQNLGDKVLRRREVMIGVHQQLVSEVSLSLHCG